MIAPRAPERFGVPGFVAGLAEDPVDDRLLGLGCVADAIGVGSDVVLAPHLALIVGQRAAAFGDAGAGDGGPGRRSGLAGARARHSGWA